MTTSPTTQHRKDHFLALLQSGLPSQDAARQAGISPRLPSTWARRDPAFATAWKLARPGKGSHRSPAVSARKAQYLALLAEGQSSRVAAAAVGTDVRGIAKWAAADVAFDSAWKAIHELRGKTRL